MITAQWPILESRGIRLEPLERGHAGVLEAAAADGELWNLWYTSVPAPGAMAAYIDQALAGRDAGTMMPWIVRESATGQVIGTTRYHDILHAARRVEIGYTWYAASRQRTRVNTTCKLMLMTHAFEALGCSCVALQADSFNFTSQRAIERLGARKDGVIRCHSVRRDGSVRDTVMYSIVAAEWPDVRRHLEDRLARNAPATRM